MADKTDFLTNIMHDHPDFDEIAYNDAQIEAELNRQYEAHCAQQEAQAQQQAQQALQEFTATPSPVTQAINEESTPNKPPYIPHAYVPRINTGGNYCGHIPHLPRFLLTKNPYETDEKTDELGHKRHSAILYDIVDRIRDYYDNPASIPSFNTANSDKRTSDRQRNSSRREAIVNLCTIMVMHMDLISLRIGFMGKKRFVSHPVKWLAKKANLSISRAKRALSDLNHSGVLSSFQRRELIDADSKTYRFHVAARAFSMAFFEALGVNLKKLGSARHWANDNADKKNKVKQKAAGEQKLIMNRINNHFGRSAKKANGQLDEDALAKQKRDAKRRNEIVIKISTNFPELKKDPVAFSAAIEECLCAEGLQLDKATPV